MKHIAVPCRGAYDQARSFTATGLGDRIHAVTIAWSYSQKHGPVTLHLTAPMMTGGEFGNKPESWAEILALLPAGHVAIQAHEVAPRSEAEWIGYLGDAESYGYSDYQPRKGFDAVPYLKAIPQLTAEPQAADLPRRFCTAQWDAGGPARRVRRQIVDAVIVGGESKIDCFRWSLKCIAYAMSKAYGHFGVDSAFFHLAQLFMPIDRIHLYCGEKRSHHVLRAADNGAQIT